MSGLQNVQNKASQFFHSKTESEQRLLKLVLVFLVLFIGYNLYSLMSTNLSTMEQKLEKQQQLNQWAYQQIDVIKNSSTQVKTESGSMTQLINSSARRFNASISRLQQSSDEVIKVGVEEMSFNDLMLWLQLLQNQHGIFANNLDIAQADTQGMVKIRRLELIRY